MKLLFTIYCFCVISSSFSQNVGIGTTTPAEKFSVGTNSQFQVDNTGNILRINDIPYSFPYIQGTSGQVLMNDGTGQLNWINSESIITLTPSNYLTTIINPSNYIRINGIIDLTQNYSILNKDQLTITGGTINGDGISYIKLGNYVTVVGTIFNNVDIQGFNCTFINCKFTGNCPRIGSEARFLYCNFDGASAGSISRIGYIANSRLNNSSILSLESLTNSDISTCTLGNSSQSLHHLSECKISGSTIYGLSSEFQFIDNRCSETEVFIGNASSSARKVNISNNSFDDLFTGATELIAINPSDGFVKFINIQNNIFNLNLSAPRSIAVIADDGNPNISRLNIQGNIFYRGTTTIFYSSNMKTIYSQNIASGVNHPTATGDLIVNNNY